MHASPIDLQRIRLLREAPRDELVDPARLERLVGELGLNNEGLAVFPPELHDRCGRGLRIWQYPTQFSKYLVQQELRRSTSYACFEYNEQYGALGPYMGIGLAVRKERLR